MPGAGSEQLPVAKGNLNAYVQFGEYGIHVDCGEKKECDAFIKTSHFPLDLFTGSLRRDGKLFQKLLKKNGSFYSLLFAYLQFLGIEENHSQIF